MIGASGAGGFAVSELAGGAAGGGGASEGAEAWAAGVEGCGTSSGGLAVVGASWAGFFLSTSQAMPATTRAAAAPARAPVTPAFESSATGRGYHDIFRGVRASPVYDPLERVLDRLPSRVATWVRNFRELHPQHEVVAFRGEEVIVKCRVGDGYSLRFVSGDPARPQFREV